MNTDTIIQTEKLTLGYGSTQIINALDLNIPNGKFTALIGPNGCGKSTLLKSFVRALSPFSGEIRVNGTSISNQTEKDLSKQIAFLPQVLPVPEGITVRQLVGYGRSPYNNLWGRLTPEDKEIVEVAIERVQIADLADRMLSDLSGGQRQRAWIAMVITQQAPIVLLDEPTTYLDINHQIELMAMIRDMVDRKQTVIAVLHDLNQAFRYADNVAILKSGDLYCSDTPDVAATQDMMQKVFSVIAETHRDPIANTPMIIPADRQQLNQSH